LKLRLILKTKTKKNKEICIKFAISPRKHIGFINFINLALKQDLPMSFTQGNLLLQKVGKRMDDTLFKSERRRLLYSAMLTLLLIKVFQS